MRKTNTMNWLAFQASNQFAVSIPFVIVALVIIGVVGLGLLWRRGNRIEAISLLNTMMLLIIIILLLFPL